MVAMNAAFIVKANTFCWFISILLLPNERAATTIQIANPNGTADKL